MKNYSVEKAGRDNPSYTHGDTSSTYRNGKNTDTHPDNERQEKPEKQEKGKMEEEKEDDPWNVETLKQDYVPWSELTDREKVIRALLYPVKLVLVLAFLYLFICSLDFLSSSFKLLGGKKAGEVFQQSEILTNPVAGLMMGVLVTVLVQSSSTSTSIVISMVGAGILTAKTAVPIVMGANIGTSVTNTIVALGQITSKNDFRRAFAGATVHDMFNWLSVIILLPLEVITGYLFRLSDAIVSSMHLNETLDINQDLLKTVTKPFTTLIVQVSSSGIKKIATGDVKVEDATLMKFCCDKDKPESCCKDAMKDMDTTLGLSGTTGRYNDTQRVAACQVVDKCVNQDYQVNQEELGMCLSAWETNTISTSHDDLNTLNCTALSDNITQQACCNKELTQSPFWGDLTRNATSMEQTSLCSTVNSTCYSSDVYSTCINAWSYGRLHEEMTGALDCGNWTKTIGRTCNKPCKFLFRDAHIKQGGSLSDEAVGAVLLVLSLLLLCVCLICIVKLLHSLLQGPMAKLIKKFVNADFPGYCGYFTGYLAILVGAGMTILVQSSSIFTSTLTPLVGMGVITLDRMYPLTLGSNIGTTATGILAALAQDVESIPRSLQVAMCHLFFNISGILIFYPFPFFRPAIPAAKFLGNTTAKYRWFAIIYLIVMFFLFPLAVFGLSIPGWYVLAIVLIPIGLVAVIVGIIKCLQNKRPGCLPKKLHNWKFLPLPLRSLEPYDRFMKKLCFCKRFQDDAQGERQGEKKGESNEAFDGVVVDTAM